MGKVRLRGVFSEETLKIENPKIKKKLKFEYPKILKTKIRKPQN